MIFVRTRTPTRSNDRSYGTHEDDNPTYTLHDNEWTGDCSGIGCLRPASPNPHLRYERRSFELTQLGIMGIFGASSQVLDIVAGFEDNKPDEEPSREEGQDAGGYFQAPGDGQYVSSRVSAHPEVFTLQAEGVVTEDHDNAHQEHTWKTK